MNVYFARMLRSGEKGDLRAEGLQAGPLWELSRSEVSEDATSVATALYDDCAALDQLYELHSRVERIEMDDWTATPAPEARPD